MNNKNRSILILDDDRSFLESLFDYFSGRDFFVSTASTIADAKKKLNERFFSVIIADQNLPDGDGIKFAEELLADRFGSKIILVTAFAEISRAVEAMRVGIFDYIQKPLDLNELDIRVARALRTADLETSELLSQYQASRTSTPTTFVGESPAVKQLRSQLEIAAGAYPAPVLVTGETGTGKGLAAHIIHALSRVSKHKFITINCAAIAETMYEEELFGHERGAFTGAYSAHKGVFELADGGTLVLDEIGEIPLSMQPKLLRVLDEGVVRRVGGEVEREVRLRVIATTNRNIEQMIQQKTFREDLYFRIAVFRITVPSLRERPQDIPPLVEQLLGNFDVRSANPFTQEQMRQLCQRQWPGNVRELRNFVERSAFFGEGQLEDLLQETRLSSVQPSSERQDLAPLAKHPDTAFLTLAELEHKQVCRALELSEGNRTVAAQMLGISRSTLKRKLRQYHANQANGEHRQDHGDAAGYLYA